MLALWAILSIGGFIGIIYVIYLLTSKKPYDYKGSSEEQGNDNTIVWLVYLIIPTVLIVGGAILENIY